MRNAGYGSFDEIERRVSARVKDDVRTQQCEGLMREGASKKSNPSRY